MPSPVLFCAAHPDDETLMQGVAIVEHLGQDVHILALSRGETSGVLDMLNGTITSAWWGVPHNPTAEGYTPLTQAEFGQARIDELAEAVRCLSSGLGTITVHEAGLAVITQQAAHDAILATCETIAPGGAVRLKSHTWVSQLDGHPEHLAIGAAVKALGDADPARFGDRRYYVAPDRWNVGAVPGITRYWDLPTNGTVAARALNALRAYGAWAPGCGRYAIGHHSTSMFGTVMAAPKCQYHS